MTQRIDELTTIAIANAERRLEFRQNVARRIRRNSFQAWGNDMCIGRTMDTLRALRNGTASNKQIAYWLNH